MKKFCMTILFLLLFLTVPGSSEAQKLPNWWDNAEVSKSLNISDGQLKKLNSIDSDYVSKVSEINGEMQNIFNEFMNMINSPKPSDKEITEKYGDLISKQNKIGKLELEKQLKIRDVLTDDQIVKLGDIRKKQWEKLKNRRKK